MFFQSLIWIPMAVLIFLGLRKVTLAIVGHFFPQTAREIAEDNLRTEIARLEDSRVQLEMSLIRSDVAKEQLAINKKIENNQQTVAGLKMKLHNLKEKHL